MGPSNGEIRNVTCKDNQDGTATVNYATTAPGDYKIILKFAGQLVEGGPFTAGIVECKRMCYCRDSVSFMNLSGYKCEVRKGTKYIF